MELKGKILKGVAGIALWGYVFLLMFDENTNLPFFGDKADDRNTPSSTSAKIAKAPQPRSQPKPTSETQTLPSQVNLSNEANHYWIFSCNFYSPDRLNQVATKVSNIIVNESRNSNGMNRRARIFFHNVKPHESTSDNPMHLVANGNDCHSHDARTIDGLLKEMDRLLTTRRNLEIIWGASDPKYFFQAKAEVKLTPYVIDICRGKRQYQTMSKLSGCDAVGVY